MSENQHADLDDPSSGPFAPSPGIGTPAASPIPVNPEKVLSDMDLAIRAKLLALSEQLGGEYHKALMAYVDMPDEFKAHVMYKRLGDMMSAVEAVRNTLDHTAAAFPLPIERPDK